MKFLCTAPILAALALACAACDSSETENGSTATADAGLGADSPAPPTSEGTEGGTPPAATEGTEGALPTTADAGPEPPDAAGPAADAGPSDDQDGGVAPDVGIADGGAHPDGGAGLPPDTTPLADYVNVFIGTGGDGFGTGMMLPGPSAPFGMVKLSPDTVTSGGPGFDSLHTAGYYYPDNFIQGFSHVHVIGTGAADYGGILFMPTIGMGPTDHGRHAFRSQFSHKREEASPGYYKVDLRGSQITAELTATLRAGFHRYTFAPETPPGDAWVVIDLDWGLGGKPTDAEVTIDTTLNRVTGYVHGHGSLSGRDGGYKPYFCAEFRSPIGAHGVVSGGARKDGETHAKGTGVMALVQIPSAPAEPADIRVGISFVDVDGACANLAAEIPGWDFATVREATRTAWEAFLGAIRIQGGDVRQKTMFHTAVYHLAMMPSLYTDVDGRYTGMDHQIHTATDFTFYSEFSGWDTYRTFHPLLNLVYRDKQRDFIRSMIDMAEKGGGYPRWAIGAAYAESMIGAPIESIIADAYLKDITDFDTDTAFEWMRRAAFEPALLSPRPAARPLTDLYREKGYYPADRVGAATSWTLELSVQDAVIAQFARRIGKDAEAALFEEQSRFYANVWDPATQFMRGRLENGDWVEPLDPTLEQEYYSEGNAWQYLWLVPHDAPGLMNLFGGAEPFTAKLSDFFALSKDYWETQNPGFVLPLLYYWHGNEPGLHTSYLFIEAGRPDLTQTWVRWVLDTSYNDTPAGLPGNDDGGTMSAWHIFTSAGFYPLLGKNLFYAGSPVFRETRFDMGGGKSLVIKAPQAGPEYIYVAGIRVNGEPLARPIFTWDQIKDGAVIEFDMSAAPTAFGQGMVSE